MDFMDEKTSREMLFQTALFKAVKSAMLLAACYGMAKVFKIFADIETTDAFFLVFAFAISFKVFQYGHNPRYHW